MFDRKMEGREAVVGSGEEVAGGVDGADGNSV